MLIPVYKKMPLASPTSSKPIKLILADQTQYCGYSFGAEVGSEGEVVFNTGMVGYPESLTDPSYRGQILVLTYPLIGNYGVPENQLDENKISRFFETSEIHIRGLIVTDYSQNYSHWQAKKSLGDWLKEFKIPGITDIDTRVLTQKLREQGTMLGRIVSEKTKTWSVVHDPNLDNLVEQVSIKEPIFYQKGRKHVVLVDCGMKNNILRSFFKRRISITRVPWNYDIFRLKKKFHGVFVSNGPGDPAILKETAEILRRCLLKKIPVFGICLGNQILGLAAGAKTYKLKYGHRSQNQPCLDLETGRCYITSQNHGFAVDARTMPRGWKVWFTNANDQTVEGIKHEKFPFLAVQFHPEATPGPFDTGFLFDQFIKLL